MAKQYFIKRDLDVENGDNTWTVLTFEEFQCFLKSPESVGRYFIDMDDIVIEASEEQYVEWRREKNHSDYLRSLEKGHEPLSLYAIAGTDGVNGEETIPDSRVNVEDEALLSLEHKELYAALKELNATSYHLIQALYLAEKRLTERDLAREAGVSQKAINKRKNKILKDLVLKLKKSQQ